MLQKDRIPQFQDEVRNLNNDTAGTVIAVYSEGDDVLFDVAGFDGKVYYATFAKNWTTINTEQQRMGLQEKEDL